MGTGPYLQGPTEWTSRRRSRIRIKEDRRLGCPNASPETIVAARPNEGVADGYRVAPLGLGKEKHLHPSGNAPQCWRGSGSGEDRQELGQTRRFARRRFL